MKLRSVIILLVSIVYYNEAVKGNKTKQKNVYKPVKKKERALKL